MDDIFDTDDVLSLLENAELQHAQTKTTAKPKPPTYGAGLLKPSGTCKCGFMNTKHGLEVCEFCDLPFHPKGVLATNNNITNMMQPSGDLESSSAMTHHNQIMTRNTSGSGANYNTAPLNNNIGANSGKLFQSARQYAPHPHSESSVRGSNSMPPLSYGQTNPRQNTRPTSSLASVEPDKVPGSYTRHGGSSQINSATSCSNRNKNSTSSNASRSAPRSRHLGSINRSANPWSISSSNQAGSNAFEEEINDEVLESHVPHDPNTIDTWIYPASENYPRRDYQFSIVKSALLHNTLVILPTGLGKTFIAAVVMYNFLRWYPTGKIIFVAPTKPLVTQQIEACHRIVGINEDSTARMMGNNLAKQRKDHWRDNRVFYCTPQTAANDCKSGLLPMKEVVCVVVDEAHHANGNHSYVNLIKELRSQTRSFRILALSASPGKNKERVQDIVNNLHIANIEYKSESDPDVSPYVYKKMIQIVDVKPSDGMNEIRSQVFKLAEPAYRAIQASSCCPPLMRRPIHKISPEMIVTARGYLFKNGTTGTMHEVNMLQGSLNALNSLLTGVKFLAVQGVSGMLSHYEQLLSKPKLNVALERIVKTNQWRNFMRDLRLKRNDVNSNPKVNKLLDVLTEHFERMKKAGQQTSCIVFANHRNTIAGLVSAIGNETDLRVSPFIGQRSALSAVAKAKLKMAKSVAKIVDEVEDEDLSNSGDSGLNQNRVGGNLSKSASSSGASESLEQSATMQGQNQKEQQKIINKFKQGTLDVLVATCIGEEGLDIGSVDLIVCFDSLKSPIRMIQRFGRAGRKRSGTVVLLVSEGKEKNDLTEGISQSNRVHKLLREKLALIALHKSSNPRMIPKDIHPSVICREMEIGNFRASQVAGTSPHKTSKSNAAKKAKESAKSKNTSARALAPKTPLRPFSDCESRYYESFVTTARKPAPDLFEFSLFKPLTPLIFSHYQGMPSSSRSKAYERIRIYVDNELWNPDNYQHNQSNLRVEMANVSEELTEKQASPVNGENKEGGEMSSTNHLLDEDEVSVSIEASRLAKQIEGNSQGDTLPKFDLGLSSQKSQDEGDLHHEQKQTDKFTASVPTISSPRDLSKAVLATSKCLGKSRKLKASAVEDDETLVQELNSSNTCTPVLIEGKYTTGTHEQKEGNARYSKIESAKTSAALSQESENISLKLVEVMSTEGTRQQREHILGTDEDDDAEEPPMPFSGNSPTHSPPVEWNPKFAVGNIVTVKVLSGYGDGKPGASARINSLDHETRSYDIEYVSTKISEMGVDESLLTEKVTTDVSDASAKQAKESKTAVKKIMTDQSDVGEKANFANDEDGRVDEKRIADRHLSIRELRIEHPSPPQHPQSRSDIQSFHSGAVELAYEIEESSEGVRVGLSKEDTMTKEQDMSTLQRGAELSRPMQLAQNGPKPLVDQSDADISVHQSSRNLIVPTILPNAANRLTIDEEGCAVPGRKEHSDPGNDFGDDSDDCLSLFEEEIGMPPDEFLTSGYQAKTPKEDNNCSCCGQPAALASEPLIKCSGRRSCNIVVHARCVGARNNSLSATTKEHGAYAWKCEACSRRLPSDARHCFLCPSTKGALIAYKDQALVHASCCWWNPHIKLQFDSDKYLTGIDIPSNGGVNLHHHTCSYCSRRVGACVKCCIINCPFWFHPSCARASGVTLRLPRCAFHLSCSEDEKKEKRTNARMESNSQTPLRSTENVQKSPFSHEMVCKGPISTAKDNRGELGIKSALSLSKPKEMLKAVTSPPKTLEASALQDFEQKDAYHKKNTPSSNSSSKLHEGKNICFSSRDSSTSMPPPLIPTPKGSSLGSKTVMKSQLSSNTSKICSKSDLVEIDQTPRRSANEEEKSVSTDCNQMTGQASTLARKFPIGINTGSESLIPSPSGELENVQNTELEKAQHKKLSEVLNSSEDAESHARSTFSSPTASISRLAKIVDTPESVDEPRKTLKLRKGKLKRLGKKLSKGKRRARANSDESDDSRSAFSVTEITERKQEKMENDLVEVEIQGSPKRSKNAGKQLKSKIAKEDRRKRSNGFFEDEADLSGDASSDEDEDDRAEDEDENGNLAGLIDDSSQPSALSSQACESGKSPLHSTDMYRRSLLDDSPLVMRGFSRRGHQMPIVQAHLQAMKSRGTRCGLSKRRNRSISSSSGGDDNDVDEEDEEEEELYDDGEDLEDDDQEDDSDEEETQDKDGDDGDSEVEEIIVPKRRRKVLDDSSQSQDFGNSSPLYKTPRSTKQQQSPRANTDNHGAETVHSGNDTVALGGAGRDTESNQLTSSTARQVVAKKTSSVLPPEVIEVEDLTISNSCNIEKAESSVSSAGKKRNAASMAYGENTTDCSAATLRKPKIQRGDRPIVWANAHATRRLVTEVCRQMRHGNQFTVQMMQHFSLQGSDFVIGSRICVCVVSQQRLVNLASKPASRNNEGERSEHRNMLDELMHQLVSSFPSPVLIVQHDESESVDLQINSDNTFAEKFLDAYMHAQNWGRVQAVLTSTTGETVQLIHRLCEMEEKRGASLRSLDLLEAECSPEHAKVIEFLMTLPGMSLVAAWRLIKVNAGRSLQQVLDSFKAKTLTDQVPGMTMNLAGFIVTSLLRRAAP